MKRAVIDIGTVSTRLIVGDVREGGVEQLLRITTITNLGVGVSETRMLTAEGIARVAEAAAGYAERIEELGRNTYITKLYIAFKK